MSEDDSRDKATDDADASENGAASGIEEIMRIYDSLRAEFGAIAELMRKLTHTCQSLTAVTIRRGSLVPMTKGRW